MKRLTDPEFVYRNAASTDIAETFRRVREELKEKKEEPPESNVILLPERMKA